MSKWLQRTATNAERPFQEEETESNLRYESAVCFHFAAAGRSLNDILMSRIKFIKTNVVNFICFEAKLLHG